MFCKSVQVLLLAVNTDLYQIVEGQANGEKFRASSQAYLSIQTWTNIRKKAKLIKKVNYKCGK